MNGFSPVGEALPPRRDEEPVVRLEVDAAAAAPAAEGRYDRMPGGSGSIVVAEAKDRMLELIEREQLPTDVRSTLAGALTGDIQRQQLLFQAMLDTWPRLQKAIGEVRRAARKAPWKVRPWAKRGGKPTAAAEKRAGEIENAIWSTRPDAARAEVGFEGIVEELAYGYFAGHHVLELRWDREREGEGMWKPRAAKVVAPRFYGYPTGAFGEEGEDRLMLNRDGGMSGYDYEEFPDHRFLLASNGGHPGHPTVAAPLRALTGYWLASVYGLKWLLQFSQLFGIPIRWAEYADEGDKAAVMNMLEKIGTGGYAAFKKGTQLNLHESKRASAALPQKELIELADRQCDAFILGQTLTTDVGDSGSRALGEVHEGVRQEVIGGVCDFVGGILTHQLIPSMLALNYGTDAQAPELFPEWPEAKDEKALAERDEVLRRAFPGLEWSEAQIRERHGIDEPLNDDDILQPGPNGAPGDPATGDRLAPLETKARLLDEETKEELEAALSRLPPETRDGVMKLVQGGGAAGIPEEVETLIEDALRQGIIDPKAVENLLAAAWMEGAGLLGDGDTGNA